MTTITRGHVSLLTAAMAMLTVGVVLYGLWTVRIRPAAEEARPARAFTNDDFKGHYGVFDSGVLAGKPYMEVGKIIADGRGHFTSVVVGYLDGTPVSPGPVTTNCDSAVNADGTGTGSCPDGSKIDFVIDDRNHEVRFMVRSTKPPPLQLSGVARRQ